jgi:prolyl-tRNA editing enzyme YbaK/EbsC (Cys-tRNA(Pro) deacylase)
MIEAIVRYLRGSGVPFRMTSYPMPEPEPPVAHRFVAGARLVDVHVVLVDGRPALVCIPAGAHVDLAALANETGAAVLETTSAELRDEYRGAPEPLPPLGGVFGVPLFVDEQVLQAPVVAFRAFSSNDYVELSYDDLALLERPRVAAFALWGELPAHLE